MQTARIACQSIGLPASAAYCFGCFFDRREPLPAAGMSAKTDKEAIEPGEIEVLEIQADIITRFFP